MAEGIISHVDIQNMSTGIVLYTIKTDGFVSCEYNVFINNPEWPVDRVDVIFRAEDEFGM